MSGSDNSISNFNALLQRKLTAINQYFLHARMLKHNGHMALADYEYKASLEAMKHADMLVEHILTQGGTPNLQDLGKLHIGHTAKEMLQNDITLAQEVLQRLSETITDCEHADDKVGLALLEKIITGQREHIQHLTTQINQNIKECA